MPGIDLSNNIVVTLYQVLTAGCKARGRGTLVPQSAARGLGLALTQVAVAIRHG